MADTMSRVEIDAMSERIDSGAYIQREHLRFLVYTARVFDEQRKLLARLAADTPQFSNPLSAIAAQDIRDAVLASMVRPSSDTGNPV